MTPRTRTPKEIVAIRRSHLGPNLSLAYDDPIKVVRGQGQYLYSEDGRQYLDLVNNVCHVGHCHPRVVAAGQQQMARLNTNSRYLHDHLAEYLERLVELMPQHLSVCYLVCSGSEANELALRLAHAQTGRREIMVLDHAYHGNTGNLVDMSPYKSEGSGGRGLPPHIRKTPCPDIYRGRHRGADARDRYVADAEQILQQHRPGVFFAEPLIGCGGQIVPPPGFLARSFEAARELGTVCVADEVQVGFGRVGTHYWAFEAQGARPDIVTMGKPIGNGHPMAAVVTTPEIAQSFDTGMEYFNTFGANPVSCAIGLAVLDVLRDEKLLENSREMGDRLLKHLDELAERHDLIGDVRGKGLYLGAELVTNRETREPAPEEARKVVDRMKERGFLLSTDGPDHNVIKIKPPMVLNRDDVDSTATALDEVLAEL